MSNPLDYFLREPPPLGVALGPVIIERESCPMPRADGVASIDLVPHERVVVVRIEDGDAVVRRFDQRADEFEQPELGVVDGHVLVARLDPHTGHVGLYATPEGKV